MVPGISSLFFFFLSTIPSTFSFHILHNAPKQENRFSCASLSDGDTEAQEGKSLL